MNTPNTATPETYGPAYWAKLVLQTRSYGHTYVHSGARKSAPFAFRAFEHNGIVFSYSGYGRSLQTARGHKYKVHARRDGKPVPTRELKAL